ERAADGARAPATSMCGMTIIVSREPMVTMTISSSSVKPDRFLIMAASPAKLWNQLEERPARWERASPARETPATGGCDAGGDDEVDPPANLAPPADVTSVPVLRSPSNDAVGAAIQMSCSCNRTPCGFSTRSRTD